MLQQPALRRQRLPVGAAADRPRIDGDQMPGRRRAFGIIAA
ncbi:MAG: hypothetical protein AVDCRST_MAG19-3318 [uncultured Thermomicrobiales bacterium]|uniref:Uncharacterized protein n=1 Tax=uncultured Thermomicrobiales bacterium TaxID=1645740 RepID=A0A6J4VET2_9BACT|nr:MAG: hypothetical protein AVDCRST_MAG19-3318 [uncultured Thermomicrobiales bacterium]